MNGKIEFESEKAEPETTESADKKDDSLVGYLKRIVKQQDRAALAHLRRGFGKRPGETMEMYPYIGRFLRVKKDEAGDRANFLTSALFAYYWEARQNAGNLGDSMRRLGKETESGGIERRFVALLNTEAGDLHHHLRHVIGLLKSKDVPVNWELLYRDIRNWESDDRWVQAAWARSYWGSTTETKEIEETVENTGGYEE